MAFLRYLAEEVAIDHADGLYSRREALRRPVARHNPAAAKEGRRLQAPPPPHRGNLRSQSSQVNQASHTSRIR
jgi:hypothetical protein